LSRIAPGANGVLAAAAAKNAEPDGYTIFSGSIGSYSSRVFMKNNPILATKETAACLGNCRQWTGSFRPFRPRHQFAQGPGRLRQGQQGQDAFRGACIKQNAMFMAAIAKESGWSFDNTFDIIPYKSTDQTIQAILSGDVQAPSTCTRVFESPISNRQGEGAGAAGDAAVYVAAGGADCHRTGRAAGAAVTARHLDHAGHPRDTILKLSRAVSESVKQPPWPKKIMNLSMVPEVPHPEEFMRDSENDIRFYVEYAKAAEG